VSSRAKVRFGWPLLAVASLALAVLDSMYEGLGWLALAIVPACGVGFVLGRVTTTAWQATAGLRDVSVTGVALAVGFGLAALVLPKLIAATGVVGSLIVPAALAATAGYLVALATRRDVLEEAERLDR